MSMVTMVTTTAYTVCILSCYLLVHHVLRTNNIKFDSLVIQNSEINYITPVEEVKEDQIDINKLEENPIEELKEEILPSSPLY